MPADSAKVSALLGALETHEFAAFASVTSRVDRLQEIILSDPSVIELIKLCRADVQNLSKVLDRTRRLAAMQIDMRYQSPWDIALVAHLLVAQACDRASADFAAALIGTAPQTWWARRVVQLRAPPSDSVNISITATLTQFGGHSTPHVYQMEFAVNTADSPGEMNLNYMPPWAICQIQAKRSRLPPSVSVNLWTPMPDWRDKSDARVTSLHADTTTDLDLFPQVDL